MRGGKPEVRVLLPEEGMWPSWHSPEMPELEEI